MALDYAHIFVPQNMEVTTAIKLIILVKYIIKLILVMLTESRIPRSFVQIISFTFIKVELNMTHKKLSRNILCYSQKR